MIGKRDGYSISGVKEWTNFTRIRFDSLFMFYSTTRNVYLGIWIAQKPC